MAEIRHQSDATQPISVMMYSTTDGKTPLPGLTLTVKVRKGTSAPSTAACTVTEPGGTGNGGGEYLLTGSGLATDLNTLGPTRFFCDAGGADETQVYVEVVPWNIYDVNMGLQSLNGVNSPGSSGGFLLAGTSTNQIQPDGLGNVTIASNLSGVIRSNTLQAGSGTTVTLDAGASSLNNAYVGCTIFFPSGTGALQGIWTIVAYNGTTKVATLDRTLPASLDNTTHFTIRAEVGLALDSSARANVGQFLGTGATVANGLLSVNAGSWNGTTITQAVPANWGALKVSSGGYVGLDFTQCNFPGSPTTLTNVVIGTVTAVTNAVNLPVTPPPGYGGASSPTAIATAVWQDTTAGDFAVPNSPGNRLMSGSSLVDSVQIETGYNLRQTISLIAAYCCGQAGNWGTQGGQGTFYAMGSGTGTARIKANGDQNGNRNTIVLSPPT